MIMTDPKELHPGGHYLAHDTNERDWSLFRHRQGSTALFMVDWRGCVLEPSLVSTSPWGKHFTFVPISLNDAQTCVVLCHHIAHLAISARAERWYAFASQLASNPAR